MKENPLDVPRPKTSNWLTGLLLWLAIAAAGLVCGPGGTWVRERFDKLLGRSASVQDDRRLQTILQDNDIAALERELRQGADPNTLDSFDQPLIHWARSPEAIDLLLRFGADPNGRDKDGDTPLMEAIRSRSLASVKLLLAAKADVNAVSPPETGTWTALDDAHANHQPEIEELLRQAGAKELRVTQDNGLPLPADGGPPFAVVREYLAAVHARDLATARLLLAGAYDPAAPPPTDEQWGDWQGARPLVPIYGGGFYWDERASLTVTGKAPAGFTVEWVIHLRRIAAEESATQKEIGQATLNGTWRIVREDWIVEP